MYIYIYRQSRLSNFLLYQSAYAEIITHAGMYHRIQIWTKAGFRIQSGLTLNHK